MLFRLDKMVSDFLFEHDEILAEQNEVKEAVIA
jgi:hypothetical protein